MSVDEPRSVVISAGFHKTHVTTAASEASARGLLRACITGAYPTERFGRAARRLRIADRGRVARLFERGEVLPDAEVDALFVPELLDELTRAIARLPVIGRFADRLSAAAWRLYGRLAGRTLEQLPPARIYHFRAGFGHSSIPRARELGMVVLCDQALAHPLLLGQLIDSGGAMPATPEARHRAASAAQALDPVTRGVVADIEASDAVVVNSEFVKDTFLALGWPPERVHVVHLGVDDNFIHELPTVERKATSGRLQLLFAGRLEPRKGADVLVEALRGLADVDWELLVAGPVTSGVQAAHRDFLGDRRVRLLGTLRRPALMRQMLSVPVFVFPSLAEGSARVVFEALACGCYVVTTPNSGTVVEDGVHGALVPPGNAERLRRAIVEASSDRQLLAEVGNSNARLIAHRYQQSDYGDALGRLYRNLATAEPGRRAPP